MSVTGEVPYVEKEMTAMPLADKMRPKTLDEVAGQKHLLGKNAPFRRIAESGRLPSLVFYGPPGHRQNDDCGHHRPYGREITV